MKKPKKVFVCSECGDQFSRWAGKCPSCGSWNSVNEESLTEKFSPAVRSDLSYNKPIRLSEFKAESFIRFSSGIQELDVVLGGGIVPGSLVLIGGEPGVGKSTLILEIARNFPGEILYISGEESSGQIGLRSERMALKNSNISISSETSADRIAAMIENEKPKLVFIDSIQTISRESLHSQAGTVTQLRECTQLLLDTAKKTGIPVFMIGHITKDGQIAGPKVLEHLVDTVLYFEGDKLNYYRLLRAVKNRFGAVGDIAVFEMHLHGLREVQEKQVFISSYKEDRSGSVISSVMEGSRSIAVEVQALVSKTGYSQARRMSEGLDNRRVILLAAVLEKFMGMKLAECDIFCNLAGGLNMDEPALDLAISASVISSYFNKSAGYKAFIGEVGLSGEVRPVGQINLRLKVIAGTGIKNAIIPKANLAEVDKEIDLKITGISNINELESYFM